MKVKNGSSKVKAKGHYIRIEDYTHIGNGVHVATKQKEWSVLRSSGFKTPRWRREVGEGGCGNDDTVNK